MEKLDEKGKEKQLYAMAMSGNGQMVMAGLWTKWKDPKSGDEIQSCTILTCGCNEVMGELHNRMPVILGEADWPRLGEAPASDEELLAILKECVDERLKICAGDKRLGRKE